VAPQPYKWALTSSSILRHPSMSALSFYDIRPKTEFYKSFYGIPVVAKWSVRRFHLEDSQQLSFYGVRLSASRPIPNLEDQDSVSPPHPAETGLPSHTPGHWATRIPQDRHVPYLLTCAPEEIHLTRHLNQRQYIFISTKKQRLIVSILHTFIKIK
jgi:hypothetical protein